MAGDWIKMRAAMTSCPKVMAMVRTVGCENEEFNGLSRNTLRLIVVGGLHAVWSAVNEHSTDGVMHGLYVEDIDDIAGVIGFGEAMESVGWLVADQTAKTISFPNFTQWNMPGKDRTAAQRMRKHREKQRVTANVTAPLRNVTPRYGVTVTTEKRREREEFLETPNGVSCPDGFAPVPAATDPADDFNEFLAPRPDGATPETVDAPTGPPRAATRPKRAKRVYRIGWNENGGFTGITDADRDLWKTAYPAVDIDRALAAAHAWLIANPAKARKSNWGAFITGWLQREQNRGGDVKSNPINRAVSHEDRRNAQSMADRAARAKTNYSWRDDARRMMTEDEYRIWRAGYERERQRRRETGDDDDDGNEFLKIRRPDAI